MASVYCTRTFLSGELHVGVRQSDPNGTQWIKATSRQIMQRTVHSKVSGRFLSEEPSTYLR